MKKIFPLGSHCFTNSELCKVPKLKEYKLYHTPFDGCRILPGENAYFPQYEFLFHRDDFMTRLLNEKDWFYKPDGDDIQAHNVSMNLRRCHIPTENGLPQVLEKIKASVKNIDFNNVLYVINMCNDFAGRFDFKQLQIECYKNGIDIVCLCPNQYSQYVIPELNHTYFINNDISLSVGKFYQSHSDEILDLLK